MLTCDSFDAAIAAHISRYQNAGAASYVSQMSVLDAEDTCHAFPVKQIDNLRNFAPQPSPNIFTEMIGKKATPISISFSGPVHVATVQKYPIESEPKAIVFDNLQNAAKLSDFSRIDSLVLLICVYYLLQGRLLVETASVSATSFREVEMLCRTFHITVNDMNKKVIRNVFLTGQRKMSSMQ